MVDSAPACRRFQVSAPRQRRFLLWRERISCPFVLQGWLPGTPGCGHMARKWDCNGGVYRTDLVFCFASEGPGKGRDVLPHFAL